MISVAVSVAVAPANKVRIQANNRTLEILRERHEKRRPDAAFTAPPLDDAGCLTMTLAEAFEVFGPHFAWGQDVPFVALHAGGN